MGRRAERLPQRPDRPGKFGLHRIDTLVVIQIPAAVVQRQEIVRIQPHLPISAVILNADAKRRRSRHRPHIPQLRSIDAHLKGGIPHDGKKSPEVFRRQFETLLLEEIAVITRIVIAAGRTVRDDILFLAPRVLQQGAKLFRDRIRPKDSGKIHRAGLPQGPILPAFLRLQKRKKIAHHIKPSCTEAKFQPALRSSVHILDKKAGNQIRPLPFS